MKTCISTYSFNQALNSGEIDYFDIPSLAKEYGFDCIEVATAGVPENEGLYDYLAKFKAKCDEVGLEIVNYTVSGNMMADDLDAEIERLKGEVDIARMLGATGMRHDCANGPKPELGLRTFAQTLPILAKGCRAVTQYAQEFGIRTMIENHGFFAQDSTRVETLVAAVDHPNFGLLVDVGNFMCADDESGQAVGRVAAHAYHVHVKDFIYRDGSKDNPGDGWITTRAGNFLRGTIVGHGNVPVKQCLRSLKSQGYDGNVSIEFEGLEPALIAIKMGLKLLQGMISDI